MFFTKLDVRRTPFSELGIQKWALGIQKWALGIQKWALGIQIYSPA